MHVIETTQTNCAKGPTAVHTLECEPKRPSADAQLFDPDCFDMQVDPCLGARNLKIAWGVVLIPWPCRTAVLGQQFAEKPTKPAYKYTPSS